MPDQATFALGSSASVANKLLHHELCPALYGIVVRTAESVVVVMAIMECAAHRGGQFVVQEDEISLGVPALPAHRVALSAPAFYLKRNLGGRRRVRVIPFRAASGDPNPLASPTSEP